MSSSLKRRAPVRQRNESSKSSVPLKISLFLDDMTNVIKAS